ncbi:MAG: PEP/pyruvate-binding domain-containing protein [Patescibacteria group bacterium]
MFIKLLKQLSKNDTDIAGGKGASLGEMTQAGLLVPPGFVVLSNSFDEFLKQTDLNVEINSIIKKVNHKDINSVEKASIKIRDLINDKSISENIKKEIEKEFNKLKSKYVAVRSSTTAEDSSIASWAGELESYLNITKSNLLESVKKCWSSLFTPRAIFYRFEKKLNNQKISVAVVVQKMIQSEVSGICFTVHPVTEDRNQMVIEAGYGLGEAIVGGMITPDTYIINKKNNTILDINISKQKMMITKTRRGTEKIKVSTNEQEKQKLNNKQIIKLAEICKKIEEHYKYPQDIEWAIENNKIYITQSRPITTLCNS